MKTRPGNHLRPHLTATQSGHRGTDAQTTRAFTLVELLLSMTILSILMLVVVNVIGIVQQQWTRSNSRVTAFREARMAFDVISRNLSQATLNTYWMTKEDPLFRDAAGIDVVKGTGYERQSELEFVCGKTTGLLTRAAGRPSLYPGHGVFFQAPLGVTRLVSATGTVVDTENMVNLLCGRGYFVAWGDDQPFRPPFLNGGQGRVALRYRYRLLEYSPTSESNSIYYDRNHQDLKSRTPISQRTKEWFQDALEDETAVSSSDSASFRGFTRPVADNIILLVISPQTESSVTNTAPESIAPYYEYNSSQTSNPGAANNGSPQGTQHLLPPLIKLTMVALDSASGERLAESGNSGQQQELAGKLATLFNSAAQYNSPTSAYHRDLEDLETYLLRQKLNYRVFTTTIVMKQARWSY
jgi:uncharacterized protein (TIGR02599 family)